MGGVGEKVSISAVVPLYGVEAYLPAFLSSLSDQQPGEYEFSVVFVDDGSPDRSGELAEQWLAEPGHLGTLVRQANAGVSAARNVGLQSAQGEWVTFPDPDDLLAPDYFRKAAEFIRRHGRRVEIVSVRLLRLFEPDTVPTDVHALQFRFMAGNRVVAMDDHPDFFQLNVASVFFRRQDIIDRGTRFRPGLHASEDALFVADFLLKDGVRPILGILADTYYVYRRRASGDSAVDQFRTEADSYVRRFRDGYAPLMEAALARSGAVPAWLQSMFLYECQWLLPTQLTLEGYAHVLTADDRAAVLDALARCARCVDEDVLYSYDATALPLDSRLFLAALVGRPLPAWVGGFRDRAGNVEIPHTRGDAIRVVDALGNLIDVHPSTLAPDYFGQDVLRHWVGAIPTDARVKKNGLIVPIVRRQHVDTTAQQWDRHRRHHVHSHGAIPSLENEVRVWKPLTGPGGSAWKRTVWRVMIWRRRAARLTKKALHIS